MFLLNAEKRCELDYLNKRHYELCSIVTETLTVCGFPASILEELIAIERIMPHTIIGVASATVLATELETTKRNKAKN